jgi:magnesium chelatase family protein
VLAHNGVLFLDELAEFRRSALEALRQPLEEGRIAIARAGHHAVYPARFQLLAACNPCPCGFAGEDGRCVCTERQLARHAHRLSGPLLDRIDMLVQLHAAAADATPLTSSARAAEQVALARERQRVRMKGEPVTLNGHMDAAMLRRHARLDAGGAELVRLAAERGLLSARGQDRVVRVARTIADLAGRERVGAPHVGSALAMRPELARLTRR